MLFAFTAKDGQYRCSPPIPLLFGSTGLSRLLKFIFHPGHILLKERKLTGGCNSVQVDARLPPYWLARRGKLAVWI
jgi:hypothetical protein